LELELLSKRIRIADLQISDLDNSRSEEIASQITAECARIIDMLNAQLLAMPNQLSGVFAALGEPLPIFQKFRGDLNKRFQVAYDALHKVKKKSCRKNIVPFNRLNGSGAIALNGAKRV
jgi:hypothetical protein